MGTVLLMDDTTVMTLSLGLPIELRRQLLRCAVSALSDAGATDIAMTITASDLVVEATV